ncbi:hypothetical protein NQ317_007946 [Molorchus minor]|uniref:Uncharacterized protein n=1 Tax=Molorchus minor TaxID=1323400 RepID=A0ABQ9JF12_9CUCU|nr:hypothetical protein NQ317_007946 [Molorchus minor]
MKVLLCHIKTYTVRERTDNILETVAVVAKLQEIKIGTKGPIFSELVYRRSTILSLDSKKALPTLITHMDDAYQHTSELNGNRPAVLRHGPPCFVIRHSELRQPYSIRTVPLTLQLSLKSIARFSFIHKNNSILFNKHKMTAVIHEGDVCDKSRRKRLNFGVVPCLF